MIKACSKKYEIPFAHRAPWHDGHCRFVHGHNWQIEFHFLAEETDKCGFVVDFGKLKPLKKLLDEWDHALVLAPDDPFLDIFKGLQMNELCKLIVCPNGTSSEGIAEYWHQVGNEVVDAITEGRATVNKVVVIEDWKNKAKYE